MISWLHGLSFFFFKQKTAYDMRISDWSSDVCSSDLIGAHADDGATLGLVKPIGRRPHLAIVAVVENHADARVGGAEVAHDRACAVGRAIVEDRKSVV